MSNPRVPQEISDYVIDFLCNEHETLRQCCLVSKSWVSRVRKHLFVHVRFGDGDYPRWSEMFPDPTNSPACHTRTMTVEGALKGIEEGNWIRGFSRVERLYMPLEDDAVRGSFIPFHELSSSLKSLHVSYTIPHIQVINLILSLPFLEDITLVGYEKSTEEGWPGEPLTVVPLLTTHTLTGTLELLILDGMGGTSRILSGLIGGLRFKKLILSGDCVGGFRSMMELVMACSGTLECIDIMSSVEGDINSFLPQAGHFTQTSIHRHGDTWPNRPLQSDKP